MFKSLTGKEVEITYFVGGGTIPGVISEKGIMTSVSAQLGEVFLTLDDVLMINSKYIVSIKIL